MSNLKKLFSITRKKNINWDMFDSYLKSLDDINAYDTFEDTILSDFIKDGYFCKRGYVIVESIKHFISCGYDVSANNGLNGFVALEALCWSSYDKYIISAAKLLLDANSSTEYTTDDETTKILDSIDFQIAGSIGVYNDYKIANIYEAYFKMVVAYEKGKDYSGIDSYLECIGKKLSSVSTIISDGKTALYNDKDVSVYTEPIIMWFDEKPLVINYIDSLVIDPVYVNDNKDSIIDVSNVFSPLINATLEKIEFIDERIFYFDFSNGYRLYFSHQDSLDHEKTVGIFKIKNKINKVNLKNLKIKSICSLNENGFHKDVKVHNVVSVALICDDDTYILYPKEVSASIYKLCICPCDMAFLSFYNIQYPLSNPSNVTWIYNRRKLSLVRLDFPNCYLYIALSEFGEIEIKISDFLYDYLDDAYIPDDKLKHLEYTIRKDD